jgi:hypothetical protein
MSQAKAVGYLELNISGFDQALKTAKNLMVAFAGGFAAYKIGDFFKDGIKDAINFGKEMQSASRAMGGFDPGALLLTQKALEKVGMGAEEARGHIGDFISQGRNVSEIFGGADNYARALKSAAGDYGSQASILSRSAEKLQSVWNTMESIGSKIKTFFLAATEEFVLPLQTALDYLNQIDLAGVGADFGKAISNAATVLMGVFKNGDMIEILKVGLTLAFQEGVNWLVGGMNYIAGITGPLIGKAFLVAMEALQKAWDFLFSGDTFGKIAMGFLGVVAQFTAKMLEGINFIVVAMQSGIQYAIQSAIEAIPGASELLGVGGANRETFGEMMENNKGPISQGFIDDVRTSGQELAGEGGEGFAQFAKNLFPEGGTTTLQKGNVFDTTESGKKLQELIEKGFKTGIEMNEASRDKAAGDEKVAKSVLTSFSGSSSKVITDSLAKVGGGGGFLRAGMSLQERSAMQTAMATKQTAETLKAMQTDAKKGTSKPALLPR